MVRDKKGAVAFDWIFGLTFLFALGLLYIIFNHAVTDNFKPVIEDMIPDDAPAKNDVLLDNTEWMSYWNVIPILFLFIVGTFWMVSSLRRESI